MFDEHMGKITLGLNIDSLRAQRAVNGASQRLTQSYARLASGMRINRASDDAAGLSIAMSLNINARIADIGRRNINDTLSLTSIAEGALDTMEGITVRQRELAEQAANGTYSTAQRAALDQESRSLTNEYNRIISTTEFNGQKIFTSPFEEIRTQAGVGLSDSIGFKFADDLSTKAVAGSSFSISSNDAGPYYVWFTLDGQGSDPGGVGTGIQVDLSSTAYVSGYTPATAASVDLAVSGTPGDWNDGATFYMSTPSQSFYFWLDRTGSYNDPGDPGAVGATGYRVDATGVSNTTDLLAAIESTITSTGAFNVTNNGGSLTIDSIETGVAQYGAFDFSFGYFSNLNQTNPGSAQVGLPNGGVVITGSQIQDAVATALAPYFSFTRAADGALLFNQSGGAVNIDPGTAGNVLSDPTALGSEFLTTAGLGLLETQLADINGDGKLDLLGTQNSGLHVRLGDGEGGFGVDKTYTTAYGGGFVLADVNNDGRLDAVVAQDATNKVVVALGNADGSFAAAKSFGASVTPQFTNTADFNHDGKLDIIVSHQYQLPMIMFGNGDGTFQAGITISGMGSRAGKVAIGDIDHDGNNDLVVGDYGGTSIYVRLGNSNGTFKASVSYATESDYNQRTVLSDLNNDGSLDMAVYSQNSTNVTFYLNNGNGTFGSRKTAPMSSSPGFDLKALDLNGDGNMDLISDGGGVFGVAFGNGNGTFRAPSTFKDGLGNSYYFSLGDIDQDGKLDIATSLPNGTGASSAILFGNGTGQFGGATSTRKRLAFGDARGTTLINQLDLTTRKGAKAAMNTLDSRLDRIHSQIAAYGAVTSRLNVANGTLGARGENYMAAYGRIMDADVAAESALLVKEQILQQAGASVLAQANQETSLALTLLRI